MARDRAAIPEPGRIRPFVVPQPRRIPLDGGLELRLVNRSTVPLVTAKLVLSAGEGGLGREQAGLAVLAADALQGGTEHRSGAALAERLEGIGTSLSVHAGWDGTRVSITCLADRLEEALPFLAEVVSTPAFPVPELERVRGERLAQIRHERSDPRSLGDASAMRHLYGDGEPYGRRRNGEVETVSGFGREDVRAFAQERYRPGGSTLVVVGDVDGDDVVGVVERAFAGWTGRAQAAGVPAAQPRPGGRVAVVHRPGAVQSEIRVGHVGVARATADYFPLTVFNSVLGGTFTSRLNMNLRERNGFTYGVRSVFSMRRGKGPFLVSTAVGTDVTAAAVREIRQEIATLVESGPTSDEVEAARDFLVGVYPLRFETTAQIAARVAGMAMYDLADDTMETYRDDVRAVDASAALEAGRRHVRPDDLTVVVVGDADQIAGELADLDIGPVAIEEPG